MTTTLILPPRFSDDSIRVWRAAGARGWQTLRLRGWRVDEPTERLDGGEVAIYGEPLFVAAVADQLGRVLLEPTFDWLPGLPQRYRQRELRAARFAELTDSDLPIFAKPADDKAFPARVYRAPAELAELAFVEPTTRVLLSEPVHWVVEFRSFVLERRVVALSPYARAGELDLQCQPEERADAAQYLEALCADEEVALPPAVVVDVGLIRDRGWAVIEANPCFGAGLYTCKADAVLDVLLRAVRRPAELTANDRPWVLERA